MVWLDKAGHYWFKSGGYDFGEDLISHCAKANRAEIFKAFWVVYFGDKGNEGAVEGRVYWLAIKRVLDKLEEGILDSVPLGLVE